jgi:RNA binding exosome subunit
MEKVGEAIAELFPFEFEIKVSRAKGHYGNELNFLEVELKNRKKIENLLRYIFSKMNKSELKLLKCSLEDRIDADNVLHIRFDKQSAYLGKLRLGSSDPIAVKVKIVTYPSRKEVALKIIENMIEEIERNQR